MKFNLFSKIQQLNYLAKSQGIRALAKVSAKFSYLYYGGKEAPKLPDQIQFLIM